MGERKECGLVGETGRSGIYIYRPRGFSARVLIARRTEYPTGYVKILCRIFSSSLCPSNPIIQTPRRSMCHPTYATTLDLFFLFLFGSRLGEFFYWSYRHSKHRGEK